MLRSKWWSLVAAVYGILNGGGAIYAAILGEWFHSTVHAALFIGGVAVWQALRARPRADAPMADDKLAQIQQSVDAIALEVERIGEAQRFNTKLAAELADKTPPERRA